jgi:hypothetical protein
MSTQPLPVEPRQTMPDLSSTLAPMKTSSSDRARVEGTPMTSSSPVRRAAQVLNLIADWLLPFVDLHLSSLDPDKAAIAKMICKALAWILSWGADQLERAAHAEPSLVASPLPAAPEIPTAPEDQARR